MPEDLSIVSFHDWAYLKYIEPALTTVYFEFFAAGQKAAEALNHAALTGEPVTGHRLRALLPRPARRWARRRWVAVALHATGD